MLTFMVNVSKRVIHVEALCFMQLIYHIYCKEDHGMAWLSWWDPVKTDAGNIFRVVQCRWMVSRLRSVYCIFFFKDAAPFGFMCNYQEILKSRLGFFCVYQNPNRFCSQLVVVFQGKGRVVYFHSIGETEKAPQAWLFLLAKAFIVLTRPCLATDACTASSLCT